MMRNPPQKQSVDIIITGDVAWTENLPWETKLFYGVIRGYCRNDFYCCYASNEYLAAVFNKDVRSVSRMLSKLEKEGFIIRARGYVLSEEGDIFYSQRLIVPTNLQKQFEKVQDLMLDAKSNKKNALRVDKIVNPGIDKIVNPNRKNNPYKNNSNQQDRNNPLPPAGENGEPYLTLGKGENVLLTESQKVSLVREFGEDLVLSLIEQLSAYIQSKVKRFKKDTDFYAVLRDWALRRNQPRPPRYETAKRAIIGKDLERRKYTPEELDALFTVLDEEDTT